MSAQSTQALKGRNKYHALSGLAECGGRKPGPMAQAIVFRAFGAYIGFIGFRSNAKTAGKDARAPSSNLAVCIHLVEYQIRLQRIAFE